MDELDRYRPFLFALAYRMTGSAGESEDLVQETYVLFLTERSDELAGEAPDGGARRDTTGDMLGAILARLCLDYLASERVQREYYEGLWLPEPVLTASSDNLTASSDNLTAPSDNKEALPPQDTPARRESTSLPFLNLLNTLMPEERVAYLLHDVYAFPSEDIAAVLDKPLDECRQVVDRARGRVDAQRPPFEYKPDTQRRLLERLILAAHQGDAEGLGALLSQDVTAWTDGGGQVAAALKPVSGRDAVARYLAGFVRKAASTAGMTYAEVNSAPGLLSRHDEELQSVLAFDVFDGLVRGVRVMLNPEKLAYVERQLREMDAIL